MTYGLFDVLTPAAVLAAKGDNPNEPIYIDLGSGVSYGTYSLSTSPAGAYTLYLNGNGLSAIASAHANHATFFSLGGSLIGAAYNSYLMAYTGERPVTLTATFPKLCRVG